MADRLFLRSGDVEWELWASEHTLEACRKGSTYMRLWVHLYHREDQLRLYGFANPNERSLFLELLRVSGIGPRQALRILSQINGQEFVDIVNRGDSHQLSRVQGIGLKTAQKIILALHGSLNFGQMEERAKSRDDIVDALVDMGYMRREVERVVADLRTKMADQSAEPPAGTETPEGSKAPDAPEGSKAPERTAPRTKSSYVFEQELLRAAIIVLSGGEVNGR